MKTRVSFVANSSSSSFIVGCNEQVLRPADFIKHWFNDRTEGFPYPYATGLLGVGDVAEFCAKNFKQIAIDIPEDLDAFVEKIIRGELDHTDNVTFNDMLEDAVYSVTYSANDIIRRAYKVKYGEEYYCCKDDADWTKWYTFEQEYLIANYKEEMLEVINALIAEMTNFKYLYSAEIGDDCNGELEHNEVIWTVVPFCHSISNH
jgi:hypothetical protein